MNTRLLPRGSTAAVVAALLTLVGCPGPEPVLLCADLAEADTACMDDDAVAECEAAEAVCPGEILVRESCPLQFDCP